MTKWQESCIKALASSPMAWEAFKMKQRNKRMLGQYLNRIWPYRWLKIENDSKVNDLKNAIEELSMLSIYVSRYLSAESSIENERYIFESNINWRSLAPIITVFEQEKPNIIQEHGNRLFYMKTNTCNIYSEGQKNFIYVLKKILKDAQGECTIEYITFCSSLYNEVGMLRQMKQELDYVVFKAKNMVINMSKHKANVYSICNSLNVGIEIEHDAYKPTSEQIKNRILRCNCVSYNSGYDGNMCSRLRENRIRLNGIKGLKGLYILLSDMKEKCALAANSSVHIHIDCEYDKIYEKPFKYYNLNPSSSYYICCNELDDLLNYYVNSKKMIKNEKALEIFSKIVDYDMTVKNRWLSTSYVMYHSDFNTIEYRFMRVSFNYSEYVIQALALIHITECIKHNSIFNTCYLEMLNKVLSSLKVKSKVSASDFSSTSVEEPEYELMLG